MGHRAISQAAVLLLAAAITGSSDGLAAQQGTASLWVSIFDGPSSQPIRNAQIALDGGRGGLTNGEGVLEIHGLPASRIVLLIQHLGHADRSLEVWLESGRTFYLTVPLEPEPIMLPEVRAEVTRPPRSRELREFYTRVRTGAGQYLTRADIDKRRARDISDLFRMLPGIPVVSTPVGDKPVMEAKASATPDRGGRATECPIRYFLDGVPLQPSHNGVIGGYISLEEIEGIEIYRRGTGVPAKFQRANNNCAVILIWKRERLPG